MEVVQEENVKQPSEAELPEEHQVRLRYAKFAVEFAEKLEKYEGTKRCLKAVWALCGFWPIAQKEDPKFSYPEQKELYDLFNEVESHKLFLMIFDLERMGKLKLLDSIFQPPQPTDETKESQNGQERENRQSDSREGQAGE